MPASRSAASCPGRDRLVRAVAAGQHQRAAGCLEQQGVQRRVRQHQPEVGPPGATDGRHAAPPERSSDDRACRRWSAAPPPRGRPGTAPGPSPRSRGHHGERPVLAVLAAAQGRHRALLPGVDREVVAAESLHRDDPALGSSRAVARDRVTGQLGAAGIEQPQPGTAGGTAHRLGVEAAVGGVGVLGPAVRAQREAGHRGARPVVGHRGHDRVPRPAVRAVDERVPEPPVGRVVQLAQAVGAGGGVRRDQGPPGAQVALLRTSKPCPPAGGSGSLRTPSTRASGGGRLSASSRAATASAAALDLQHDTGGVVADPAGQAERRSPGARRTGGSPRPAPGRTRAPGPARRSRSSRRDRPRSPTIAVRAAAHKTHRVTAAVRLQLPRSLASASSRIAAPSASLRRSFTYARCVLYGSLRGGGGRVLAGPGRPGSPQRGQSQVSGMHLPSVGEARAWSRGRWRTSTRPGPAARSRRARPRPSDRRRPGCPGSRCHLPRAAPRFSRRARRARDR